MDSFDRAHKFSPWATSSGHYLLHRTCLSRWDSLWRAGISFNGIPLTARLNIRQTSFAANLLMPLDDFPTADRAVFERSISTSSLIVRNRYRVSLIAATLRWLAYTERRAVLVVSRDGYILWARSSTPALKTGAYYRTSAALSLYPSRRSQHNDRPAKAVQRRITGQVSGFRSR